MVVNLVLFLIELGLVLRKDANKFLQGLFQCKVRLPSRSIAMTTPIEVFSGKFVYGKTSQRTEGKFNILFSVRDHHRKFYTLHRQSVIDKPFRISGLGPKSF